jgi:hypothetical protein
VGPLESPASRKRPEFVPPVRGLGW